MLGYEILRAKKTFEIKDSYSNKKFQFKEGKLYIGRPTHFWNIRIYDDKKDGVEFIQQFSCMGPRYPHYRDFFDLIEKNHASNKKVFTKMLDILTKNKYVITEVNNYEGQE